MVELVPSVKTAGKILYREQNIFDNNYSKKIKNECRNGIPTTKSISKSIYDNITYGQNPWY